MLRIDFLNVGKGNCAVLSFPSGNLTVIDIDNSRLDDDSETLQDPIDFLNVNYPNQSIFRFILTHPDLDHISGLHELSNSRSIHNFWDTDTNKKVDLSKLHLGGYDKNDWLAYQNLRNSKENPIRLKYLQSTEPTNYWKEDNITILAPSQELVDYGNQTDEYNHCSYVLMVEHEGIKILFGGDASKECWRDILKRNGREALSAHVFLAPHHGSPDNVEKDVFQYIEPQYVIVSDHRGHNYDYSYYNSIAKEQVYSTKHYGNVTLNISQTEKQIFTERNS